MKIRHLELLLAVSRAGSMSRAATPLGVSQTALSRIVREIEETHGIRIFERTGRGVRPSRAGEEFLGQAARVVAEFDKLLENTRRLRDGEVGELNVSIPLRVGRLVMAPILTGFHEVFPNASIHVFENLNDRTQELLVSGEMDIGVFYSPPKPSSLNGEVIAREELYAFGSNKIFSSDSPTITMAEVATYPLLLQAQPAHYRNLIEASMRKVGFTPQVGRELETIASHAMFAKEGAGLTILPYSNLWEEVAKGDLVARKIVKPTITRSLSIATCTNSANPILRGTVSLIKQAFTDNAERARWLKIGSETLPKAPE